jgi:gelsolin
LEARIYEGSETIQFHSILQSLIVFKVCGISVLVYLRKNYFLFITCRSFISIVYQGGLSDAYKNYIAEKEIPDETYKEDGVALFRIQGSGPVNMQAIQVDPVCHLMLDF